MLSLRATSPALECVRCRLPFSDAPALRSHWRAHHARRAAASGGGSSSSSSSSDGGGASEVGDGASSGDSGESSGDEDGGDEAAAAAAAAASLTNGPLHLVRLRGGGDGSAAPPLLCWVFRAVLRTSGVPALKASADDAFRTAPPEAAPSDLWAPGDRLAVLLLASGFFVATVFVCEAPGAGGALAPTLQLHKRCSHYTTRRKQGGSQSAHDASRGAAANSAGAQLRRAGEAALEADVRALLGDAAVWAPALAACRRIFFAAPRRAAHVLFDGGVGGRGGALPRGDARLHRVPLATGRPSVAEAMRVAETLMALRVADEAALAAAAAERVRAANAARAARVAACGAWLCAPEQPDRGHSPSSPPAAALARHGAHGTRLDRRCRRGIREPSRPVLPGRQFTIYCHHH